MKTSRRRIAGLVGSLSIALGTVIVAQSPAVAVDTTPRVMATTQRMTGPHLSSYYQHGTYSAGTSVTLYCYQRGQSVKGYYSPYISGGYDNLWYQTSDGHWIADVDINTGSNSPVVGSCAKSVDTNQWYELVSKNSGKAIDVAGGSTANGTRLQQYTRNNTSSQRFRFVATSSGYYRIVPKTNSRQGWDIKGGSTSNGAKAQVWSYGGSTSQQFKIQRMAGGGYRLTPRHVTNRCLDVPGSSKNNSVQLQIWTCNSATNQTFYLNAKSPVSTVKNVGSGVCDYVKSGGNYVKGDGKELGTYTLAGWRLPVCGPRPNYDGGLVGAAGRGVDPFGGTPDTGDLDGYQCTELTARWLYRVYGAKYANAAGNYNGGNGKDVVNNYAARFPTLFTKLSDARTSPPKAGDVISFNTGDSIGHVGIVYSVSIDASGNGGVVVLEQNSARSGGSVGKSTYTVRGWKVEQAINWLRKK